MKHLDYDTNIEVKTFFNQKDEFGIEYEETDDIVILENDYIADYLAKLEMDDQGNMCVPSEGLEDSMKTVVSWIIEQITKLYETIRRMIVDLISFGKNIVSELKDGYRYTILKCDHHVFKKCQTIITIDRNLYRNFDNTLDKISKHVDNTLKKCLRYLDTDTDEIKLDEIEGIGGYAIHSETTYYYSDRFGHTSISNDEERFLFKYDYDSRDLSKGDIIPKFEKLEKYSNILNNYQNTYNAIKEKLLTLSSIGKERLTLLALTIPSNVLIMYTTVLKEYYMYFRILTVSGEWDLIHKPLIPIIHRFKLVPIDDEQ